MHLCSHGGSDVALHCSVSSRGIYSVGISALRCFIPLFAMVNYWPPLYARGAVFSLFRSPFGALTQHYLHNPLSCFHVRSTMSMYASVNYPHQYRRISSAVMYLRPLSRRTLVSMPPHCAPMFIAL